MITITRAVQTAIACPSQWDLWDAEGNYYYARYRSASGSVVQYRSENWLDADWIPDDQIDKTQPGWGIRANVEFVGFVADFHREDVHPLDGMIGLHEFCALAGLKLAPDCIREGYGDHVRDKLMTEGIIAEPGSELEGFFEKWNEASS